MDEADGWAARPRLQAIVDELNAHARAADFVYLPGDFDELEGLTRGGSPLDTYFGFDAASGNPALIAALAVLIGIVLAAAILALTGYFTGTEFRPVKDVGRTSLTGAATVILDRKSTRLNSSHIPLSRMPSSA